MKVNSSDTLIRQELLSKILGNKEVEFEIIDSIKELANIDSSYKKYVK